MKLSGRFTAKGTIQNLESLLRLIFRGERLLLLPGQAASLKVSTKDNGTGRTTDVEYELALESESGRLS